MNHITIELCAEDRARLDSLIVLAARLANREDLAPAEEPTDLDKAQVAIDPAPIEEEPQPETTSAPVKPSVTIEQIQQKVVQLCAAFGGKKKAQVREVISAYGAKVSDLKDQPDKWDEVWDKLAMIEIEEVGA